MLLVRVQQQLISFWPLVSLCGVNNCATSSQLDVYRYGVCDSLAPVWYRVLYISRSNFDSSVARTKLYDHQESVPSLFQHVSRSNSIGRRTSVYYRNVKQLSYQTVPLVRRQLDKQLTVMVLTQVVFNKVAITSYIIINFFSILRHYSCFVRGK